MEYPVIVIKYPVVMIKYPVVVITYPAVWNIPPDIFRMCVRQQSLKLSSSKIYYYFGLEKKTFLKFAQKYRVPNISLGHATACDARARLVIDVLCA